MQHIVATLEGHFGTVAEAQKVISRIMRFAKLKNMQVNGLSQTGAPSARNEAWNAEAMNDDGSNKTAAVHIGPEVAKSDEESASEAHFDRASIGA